jgi:cellulose synthase/poly-beta-1,6-N-acetylglucosamine synthase-like glycosyltransferase
MILSGLGEFFLALTLVGCGFIAVADLALLYQLARYLVLRRGGLADEAMRLAKPLPADAHLPHVVLQIPTFNEGALVERSIENAMRLDWPRDRLHIQICDDSIDGTTAIARAAAERAAARGFDVTVFHRSSRKGFKAGSLHEAMSQSPYDYFAILDVDYISPPDFLRRCMVVLLHGPRLAFVQARPDYLNSDANILTRTQTLILDYHYALEQAVRSWSHQALPFNGTCGVWRREGIELGGGWRGESLTEDWELSYHARLKGMRGMFITSVSAAGELPHNLEAWVPQQKRWARGIGQVARMMLPRVFASQHLSLRERFGSIFPMALWLAYSVFTAAYLAAIPALVLKPSLWLALTVYLFYVATYGIFCALAFVGRTAAGRRTPVSHFLQGMTVLPVVCLYISWIHLWVLPSILLGRRRIFVRTPKRGAAPG